MGLNKTLLAGLIAAAYSVTAPSLDLDFVNQQYTRVGATQSFADIVTLTRASSATRINASGVLETVASNVPRIDYDPVTLACRGLLIEEQRTNLVRNSTMVGGSGGVWPTNWSQYANNGLTASVVGVGAQGGMNYVDARVFGTTTGGAGAWLYISGSGASSGQTLSRAVTAAIVAGALGAGSAEFRMEGRASGGAVQETWTGPISLSAALQRFTFANTLGNASTESALIVFYMAWSSGTAVDVTVRLFAPQLEVGAFSTSFIPTTTAQVTRAADVASINTLSPWFNATEGTLCVEFDRIGTNSGNYARVVGNDANTSSLIELDAANLQKVGSYSSSGFLSKVVPSINTANGSKVSAAVAYSPVGRALTAGGAAVATDSYLPSTTTKITLGSAGNGAYPSNGHIRKVRYFPKRLSNAQLQVMTA